MRHRPADRRAAAPGSLRHDRIAGLHRGGNGSDREGQLPRPFDHGAHDRHSADRPGAGPVRRSGPCPSARRLVCSATITSTAGKVAASTRMNKAHQQRVARGHPLADRSDMPVHRRVAGARRDALEACGSRWTPSKSCGRVRVARAVTAARLKEEGWCERGDSNPHGSHRSILSRLRLPFRHSRRSLQRLPSSRRRCQRAQSGSTRSGSCIRRALRSIASLSRASL